MRRGSDAGSESDALQAYLRQAVVNRSRSVLRHRKVVDRMVLATKGGMHRFSRELLSQHELYDALLLAASALVVLPLVPDRAIDPYGVINPAMLWRLVVLVMAIGAIGHIALRLVGARHGLPLAGFFAGFASSTAAVAGFGTRVRQTLAIARRAYLDVATSRGALVILAFAVWTWVTVHQAASEALDYFRIRFEARPTSP